MCSMNAKRGIAQAATILDMALWDVLLSIYIPPPYIDIASYAIDKQICLPHENNTVLFKVVNSNGCLENNLLFFLFLCSYFPVKKRFLKTYIRRDNG